MQWQDEGIILACKRLGESGLKLDIFTPGHGKASGMVKGGASRKQRSKYDIGNIGQFTWRGRLSEQLGQFTAELTSQPASTKLNNPLALALINSACGLTHQCMAEGVVEANIYQHLSCLLTSLDAPHHQLMSHYVWFEVELLAASGFALDLSKCAATNQVNDLVYVSPKSGCAVSKEAGKPYHERMLTLPSFMLKSGSTTTQHSQIIQGLTMTSYFLERVASEMLHLSICDARARLLEQYRRASNQQHSLIGHNSA